MLHMHGVVHRLRETAGDRLRDSKQAIEQLRAEKRVMNEVVPHPVDVRIHHQASKRTRESASPTAAHAETKSRARKDTRDEKAPPRWNGIPACVREELGIRGRAFYSDRVSSHGLFESGRPDTFADNRLLAR
jgi:hypothetical protein